MLGEGTPQNFHVRLQMCLASTTCRKCGWDLLSDLPLRRLAKKQQATFTGVGKYEGTFVSRLWNKVYEISRDCTGHLAVANAVPRYIVFRSEDIRHGVSKSSKKRTNVKVLLWPFSGGMTPTYYGTLACDLLSTVWQSLVEFRLLTSLCDAWQWSGMQNLQRVGKNSGPILNRLWTKIHEFWAMQETHNCFQCPHPIVYVVLRSEDIRH